jgi:hypothetical protein
MKGGGRMAKDCAGAQGGCDPEQRRWAQLTTILLHPTQLELIEAMRWIGEPVSPSQLVRVFKGGVAPPAEKKERNRSVASLSYHMHRLVEFDILRFHSSRRVRGVVETFYIFDLKPQK